MQYPDLAHSIGPRPRRLECLQNILREAKLSRIDRKQLLFRQKVFVGKLIILVII